MLLGDQAEAVDESSIQERMAALLEAEEANPEVEEPQEEQDSEEQVDSEQTEETEEPEEPVIELNYNGEIKAFKKSEVVDLAQKGYDYTTKTQQLAEQRKALDEQTQLLQQSAAVLDQLSDKSVEIKAIDKQLAQYKQIDWHTLAQNDPMQYMTYNQTYQQLKEARAEAVNEYQQQANELTQANERNRQQLFEREQRLLIDAIPELRGEKAQQTREELMTFLLNEGLQKHEIDTIVNHRAFKIAFKAMKYEKLMASKPEITKRMAEAPKVIKGKQPAVNNNTKDLRDRARRGDERAIQALIEKTL